MPWIKICVISCVSFLINRESPNISAEILKFSFLMKRIQIFKLEKYYFHTKVFSNIVNLYLNSKAFYVIRNNKLGLNEGNLVH